MGRTSALSKEGSDAVGWEDVSALRRQLGEEGTEKGELNEQIMRELEMR